MNYKYAVVTFNFNNYEILRDPWVVDENAEYICLTDNKNLQSNVWNIRYIPELDNPSYPGIYKTYYIKYKLFNYINDDIKYVIGIDGSCLIKSSLLPVLQHFENNNYDIGLSVHCERHDFLEEYATWRTVRQLDPKYIENFIRYIFSDKPKIDINNCGLLEATVKIYKNNDIVKQFMRCVDNTLKKACNYMDKNDQCYFTYTFSKFDDKMNTLFFSRNFYESNYIQWYFHNTKKPLIAYKPIPNGKYNLFGKTRKVITF